MRTALPGENQHPERTIELTGQAHSSYFPLARLLELIILLQTDRCPNARELAEVCEVSRRTIYRDLATLSAAGIAVAYRPDRRGYAIARSPFLQPLRIEEREALALLILCSQGTPELDLGHFRSARRAVDKIIQGLPEEIRERLQAVSEVLCGPLGDDPLNSERRSLYELVLGALAKRYQIRIRIRMSPGPDLECTKMAVYRMTLVDRRWCMIGRSTRHCRVILVALQDVEQAELTADPYTIPPRFDLRRFLAGLRSGDGELPGEPDGKGS
jgi:predicted DNA-binding transcriptional regulator YafY